MRCLHTSPLYQNLLTDACFKVTQNDILMLNTQFLKCDLGFCFVFNVSALSFFFFNYFLSMWSSRHWKLSGVWGEATTHVAVRGLLFAVAHSVPEHRLRFRLQEHSGSVVAVPEL